MRTLPETPSPLLPSAHGTFPPPPPYNKLDKVRRPHHVRFPALVHPLRDVLAPGHPRPGRLPVHLAASAPVPHRRRSRPRSSGNNLPGDHAPVPPASRPIPHLSSRKKKRRVEQAFQACAKRPIRNWALAPAVPRQSHQLSITFNPSLTTNRASVARCTSSAVNPGATSSNTNPRSVTRMYAISVTIVSTTFTPVRGNVQLFKILGAPSRVVCSIATTVRRA